MEGTCPGSPAGDSAGPLPSGSERFTQRYEEIASALIVWANLRIHRRYREAFDPEDLVQEVWLRAYRCFATYDAQRSFRGWIFGVAKNVLLEAHRTLHKREKEVAAGGSTTRLDALANVPAEVTTITMRAARNEAVVELLQRVEALEEIDRKLVVFCGLEEMPQRDAAERLGLGVEATAKRWQRLRARMREWNLPRDVFAAAP